MQVGAENGCSGPVAAACGICWSGQGPDDGVGTKGQRGAATAGGPPGEAAWNGSIRGAPNGETPWAGHGGWP